MPSYQCAHPIEGEGDVSIGWAHSEVIQRVGNIAGLVSQMIRYLPSDG